MSEQIRWAQSQIPEQKEKEHKFCKNCFLIPDKNTTLERIGRMV